MHKTFPVFLTVFVAMAASRALAAEACADVYVPQAFGSVHNNSDPPCTPDGGLTPCRTICVDVPPGARIRGFGTAYVTPWSAGDWFAFKWDLASNCVLAKNWASKPRAGKVCLRYD